MSRQFSLVFLWRIVMLLLLVVSWWNCILVSSAEWTIATDGMAGTATATTTTTTLTSSVLSTFAIRPAYTTSAVVDDDEEEVHVVSTTIPTKDDDNDDDDNDDHESSAVTSTCSIYMARASTKGNPGYGVYTTRNIRKGEPFLQNAPYDGPSIPILDYDESWAPKNNERERQARRHFVNTFSNYWWTRGKPDHVAYLAEETADFQLTFGTLPNHHCVLPSLATRYPSLSYADHLISNNNKHYPTTPSSRSTEVAAAAGAYSYHHGRVFYASRNVAAGEEIYLNYGHCKRDLDYPNEWFNFIPMPKDYEKAANIVRREFIPAFLDRGELPKESSYNNNNHNNTSNLSDMVLQLLPSTLEQVQLIIQQQMTMVMSRNHNDDDDQETDDSSSSVLAQTLALFTASERRTPEWIRANGVCVEHLKPSPSTIPGAGEGAFAQHFIAKGEIVVPAPMLQVLDRDALRMYNEQGMYYGQQLLINYCHGHPESTMLLCPTTNAALINHNQQHPNAIFQWHNNSMEDTTDNTSSSSLFNKTIDEFWNGDGRGVRMDVIALRDIQVGEEVFVDYGPEWEMAWQEHVRRNPHGLEPVRIVSTEELNAHEDIPDPFLSHNLREKAHYDPHILIGCQYYVTEDEDQETYHQENKDWRNLDDLELLRRYADREGGFFSKQNYQHHHDNSHWPCTIIRREDNNNNNNTYLVRIHQHPNLPNTPWEENNVPRFVQGLPRSSIHFFTAPYTSDQTLRGTFRHPIGIPDEVFPMAWKNVIRRHRPDEM